MSKRKVGDIVFISALGCFGEVKTVRQRNSLMTVYHVKTKKHGEVSINTIDQVVFVLKDIGGDKLTSLTRVKSLFNFVGCITIAALLYYYFGG